jgi:predicted small lipoprotein YifL
LLLRGLAQNTMSSRCKFAAVLALLAVSLFGCGVRGSLETPTEAVQNTTAQADSGQGKKEGEAPKPHQPSILDGLLR